MWLCQPCQGCVEREGVDREHGDLPAQWSDSIPRVLHVRSSHVLCESRSCSTLRNIQGDVSEILVSSPPGLLASPVSAQSLRSLREYSYET